jgi:hypothetical protein
VPAFSLAYFASFLLFLLSCPRAYWRNRHVLHRSCQCCACLWLLCALLFMLACPRAYWRNRQATAAGCAEPCKALTLQCQRCAVPSCARMLAMLAMLSLLLCALTAALTAALPSGAHSPATPLCIPSLLWDLAAAATHVFACWACTHFTNVCSLATPAGPGCCRCTWVNWR